MLFRRRATQAEYFDAERPLPELEAFFRSLDRLNRLFVFAEPFQRFVPRLLSAEQCRSLSVLDLGAGNGALDKTLTQWARRRGWEWQVTNLDLNADALNLNPNGRNVVGSVLALPFQEGSFDLVIASQMTHHLSEAEVRQHLREAWRVARLGILLSDLHRNAALYGVLWLLCRAWGFPKPFREDALLSVKRSWRVAELERLAGEAGIPNARVWLHFGARVMLYGGKAARG